MINKSKNINLQITISKADNEKLQAIINNLSAKLDIELTKSQAIAFLIKNYGKTAPNQTNQATKQPRVSNINYQAQINALKDKLNASYPELEKITGIPASTLKKYAAGKQQPKGQNEDLILQALARYGIK